MFGIDVVGDEASVAHVFPPADKLGREAATDQINIAVAIQVGYVKRMHVAERRIDYLPFPIWSFVPVDPCSVASAANHVDLSIAVEVHGSWMGGSFFPSNYVALPRIG